MSNFYKNEDCPPSQVLLAYQAGDLENEEARSLRPHLNVCEFCAAEVAFYGRYPQIDEPVEAPDIPEPLFELAEALLKKDRNNSKIDALMRDLWV